MSIISFRCTGCAKMFRVPADKAGKKAKCSNCGAVVTIPELSTSIQPAPEPPARTSSDAPARTAAATQKAIPRPTGSRDRPPTPPPPPSQPPVPEEQAVAPAHAEYISDGPPPLPPVTGAATTADDFDSTAPYDNGYEPDISRRPAEAGWRWVRLGLLLVFIGSCVVAGGFVLQTIGYLLLSVQQMQMLAGSRPSGFGNTFRILLAIAAIISILGTVTCIVGYVFGMLGPNKYGSLGLSIAATAVASIYILLALIFELPLLFDRSSMFLGSRGSFFGAWFMLLLIQLLSGAEAILYPLVLRGFLLGQKQRSQTGAALILVFIAGGYVLLRLFNFILWYVQVSSTSLSMMRAMGWLTLILLWLGIFAYGTYITWYILYLWRTRSRIEER